MLLGRSVMQGTGGFDIASVGSAPTEQIDIGSGIRTGSRLNAWRDVLNNYYYPLDLTSPATTFNVGRLSVHDVASIRIGIIDSDPMTVKRNPSHIGRSGDDFFMMPITATDSLGLTQRDRECEVRPGDVAFISTGDPYVYFQPKRTVIAAVRLPAEMIRERIPWVDDMTARQCSRERPLVRIFTDLLRSMIQNSSALSASEAELLRHSLFDLLALALTMPGEAISDESSVRLAHRQRILHFIERNILDQDLGSALVANGLGLSPRYVQRIFAERGETLTEVIRKRRIMESQQLLKSRNYANKSIEEIAYAAGFTDPAYFSRVFRQETSMSPGEYRKAHSADKAS